MVGRTGVGKTDAMVGRNTPSIRPTMIAADAIQHRDRCLALRAGPVGAIQGLGERTQCEIGHIAKSAIDRANPLMDEAGNASGTSSRFVAEGQGRGRNVAVHALDDIGHALDCVEAQACGAS